MKIKYLLILPIVAVFVLSGFSFANAQSDIFTQNLYYGLQNNSQVTQIQEFLTSQGLYSGPITGNYYFLTMNAVKAFQSQQGITPAAGYFGPVTMAAANKIADTEVGASNSQAISETGTSTPSVTTASTTPQLQLAALMQEVALLQQQLQAQQSSTQQQSQTLQQIAQNTTPPVATVPAPTPTQPQTSTPAPTTRLTVNGSTNSITIPYGTATNISWSSTNASSCNVSPSGWSGASGNQNTGNLTTSQTYSILCTGVGGSTSASLTVGVSASPTTPITTAWIKVNGQTGTVTLASGTYGADITWGSSNALAEPYGCIVGLPGASGALGNSGESVTGLFQHSNWPVSIQCQGAYNDASATVTVITSNPPISGQTLPNTVTITTPPPVISVDDKLSSLSVNGVSVPNFVSSTLSYNYPLPPGTTASQIVTATTNNMNATEIINQAVSPTGSATVLVTAQNGTTTQTYTINFNVLPRLGVTVTQNISKMVQWAGNSTDLGDITLTANGQGPVTLHSLNITFVDGGDNGGDDQDVMTAFLTPAYGFGLKDGAVDVTSPIANGGLAAVATDGSYSGGREIVSWVFPNNNLVISPGSQVTLHLWGNIGNFGSFSVNGEPVIYSTTASIVAQSDIQYSDSLGSIGNLNSLLPNEIPITIYSVEIQPG